MGTGRKILLIAMADYRVRGRSIRATCNETGCKFGGKACRLQRDGGAFPA